VLDPKDFRTDRTTSSVLSRATSLSSSPPSPFIAYHPDFQRLFQPTSAPSLEVIAQDDQDTQPFHEAGIWSERTQSVWFTSNRRLGRDGKAYTTASRMRLSSVGDGVERDSVNARLWEEFQHDDGALPTPNGGTILPNGNLLFCDQGYQTSTPSSLVVVDPAGETRPQVILNNYHGLPFNSLNDVVVYPSTPSSSLSCTSSLSSPPDFAQHGLSPTQTILFTDPCYGSEQGFKPPPVLPNQVYAFDPTTGSTWVIADGFDKPNGIVVDEVRGRCYITDTGFIRGCGTLDGARPSAMSVAPLSYVLVYITDLSNHFIIL
jgi:gluconolactonase